VHGGDSNTGIAAVFYQICGCNLWSGQQTAGSDMNIEFCDTDFVRTHGSCFFLCATEEEALSSDYAFIEAPHAYKFEIAIQTNGIVDVPHRTDWVYINLKAQTELILHSVDEIKPLRPRAVTLRDKYRSLKFCLFSYRPWIVLNRIVLPDLHLAAAWFTRSVT
jgi:organic radical activating enzyme